MQLFWAEVRNEQAEKIKTSFKDSKKNYSLWLQYTAQGATGIRTPF